MAAWVRHLSRTLRRAEFYTAKNHCVPPNFFHHIFLVRSSQTCTSIGAKIPRQCTIENCPSLQRRTHFRTQTFHRYLQHMASFSTPASARQTAKFNAKSYLLNTLLITTVLSSTQLILG